MNSLKITSKLEEHSSNLKQKLSYSFKVDEFRTPQEHLKNITEILNLSVSDMENIFNVTRKNIYMWIYNESIPESKDLERLQTLSNIADIFKFSGVARPGSLLKMKSFNSKSLIDIIKSGQDWKECVNFLISESRTMELGYKNSGLFESKTKKTNDWQITHSIPYSSEDF